ncbi:hypothetical protein J5N97_000479 [Dioscorea zingiberensis]|uniref:KHDC4/BBP-like KH-domain type I domain-containing protein n=1 Tax=Dioscorea zingiberensis TaxID=325984 RepID=A0A9D5BSH2_9LILI|nr:hypothetical protein J5N97_000479 [Dioscorea zingiberensis]
MSGKNTIAVLWLALSGFSRSNGMLNAGYFCFQTLHQAYDAVFFEKACFCRGVGFLKYFQVKQLPNFLLASPILSLALCSIVHSVKSNPENFFSLGFHASTEGEKFCCCAVYFESWLLLASYLSALLSIGFASYIMKSPGTYKRWGYVIWTYSAVHSSRQFCSFQTSTLSLDNVLQSISTESFSIDGFTRAHLPGDKNVGASDHSGGESKKQVQRKTKWGADLTQDASVRKGRALAYQVPLSDITALFGGTILSRLRVDQITQQLKSGISEFGNNENVPSPSQDPDHMSSTYQVDKENNWNWKSREAIGEILKLNPNYKAPADYKPLLKEATVPIPVNEYPTYNILGLIYGPGGDNQKQLEKGKQFVETGAKIQVYGTKAETGEKAEIKQYAGSEIQAEYEKLYVHVSADTFEKVDAAVAVIELLVTSVSGNLSAVAKTALGDNNAHVPSQGQDRFTSDMVPTTMVDQGPVQPATGPTQLHACAVSVPWSIFLHRPTWQSNESTGLHTNEFSKAYSQQCCPSINITFQLDKPAVIIWASTSSFPQTQHLPPAVLQHTYMPPDQSWFSWRTKKLLYDGFPAPSSVQTNVPAPVTFLGNATPNRPKVPSFCSCLSRHMTPQPGNQVLSRPQVGDQISQPSAHINAVQFARNSTAISVPPRLATFPDINPVAPRTSLLPMRPGNFNQAHQMPNLPSPLPPRPGGHIQIQHSYPAQLAPNQQFINNPFASGKSSNPGGHQLYDPFSSHF